MNHSATRLSIVFALLTLLTSAPAATLRFDPAGAQLDTDAILDITMSVGDLITFDVKIDTVGLTNPLVSFAYFFSYDRTELEFVRSALDPGNHFGTDTGPTAANPPPAANAAHAVDHTGGSVAADTALFVLDSFTFRALPGLVNDGAFDFRIERFSARVLVGTALNTVTGTYTASQQVEVQPGLVPLPTAACAGVVVLGGLAIRRPARRPDGP